MNGARLRPVTESAKRELFFGSVVGLAEGRDFYTATDERFVDLVGRLALADDGWLVRFIGWLRSQQGLGSAAVVAAVEMVRVRLGAGLTSSGGNRKVISDALRRADEPGALLAYWFGRYGRSMPKPIRHGVADAVRGLYDERAVAAYDTIKAAMRFADVIDFINPKPASTDQRELFGHAVARRHGEVAIPVSLPLLQARARLYALTPEQRRTVLAEPDLAQRLAEAGMTADLLDGWLLGRPDPRAWEAMLPSMSYTDRLDRLADFDACGLSRQAVRRLSEELADAARIADARIRPLRLYEAACFTPERTWAASRAWTAAIERALTTSLTNVPVLPGRTLILIDRSDSMFTQVTRGRAMTVADRAAMFGTVLALRAEDVTLVQFGTGHHRIEPVASDSLPMVLSRFQRLGDGTAADAVRGHFHDHDRVVIITDEPDGSAWQGPHPVAGLPHETPSYIWNVAATPRLPAGPDHGRRFVFRGLGDAAFDVIPLIEAVHRGRWPFDLCESA
jgi:hypothetical protein